MAVTMVTGTWAAGTPAHADAAPHTGTNLSATLLHAYLAARGLYPTAVSGVRIQRMLTVGGVTWVAAQFTPSSVAPLTVAAKFSDGAGTALFELSPGHPWRLVHIGPYACAPEAPAPMRGDWSMAGCRFSPQQQRADALTARAGLGAAHTVGERIARIALSQVGVADLPAAHDFRVDCDPYTTMVGATSANGNGCGTDTGFGVVDENEPWCADFTKWVWQQAGITTGTSDLNAGAGSFYNWAVRHGQAPRPDTGTPAVGDAVVFLPPGPVTPATTYGDHVGTITGINSDGTVNMVNGDFLGTDNISTQYNTNIDLTSFAARQWTPGEHWVLVAPPSGVQPAAPHTTITAPGVAAAGTPVHFDATTREPADGVQYRWTFGDGRTTNTTGAHVVHTYAGIGAHPVTMTAVSKTGTVETRTRTVDVVGSSSTFAAAPNRAVWYLTTPVLRTFLPPPAADGTLTAFSGDGDRWRDISVPDHAGGTASTALVYPDLADAPTTHDYYRGSTGRLVQSVDDNGRWTTRALAGVPARDSALAADARPAGTTVAPAVYFFDSAGRLERSAPRGNTWTAAPLPAPATGDRSTLALVDSVTVPGTVTTRLVYQDRLGGLTVLTHTPRGWRQSWIWSPDGVAPHTPIAADRVAVYFRDGRGRLARATLSGLDRWVTELPATPVAGSGLIAVTTSTGHTEVFFRDTSGPVTAGDDGRRWQVTALPHPNGSVGSSDDVVAASSYPLPGQPDEVVLREGSGSDQRFFLVKRTDPGADWSVSSLP